MYNPTSGDFTASISAWFLIEFAKMVDFVDDLALFDICIALVIFKEQNDGIRDILV